MFHSQSNLSSAKFQPESLQKQAATALKIDADDYHHVKSKLEMFQGRYQLLRSDLHRLQLEKNELAHQLHALQASHSWRFTLPARALRRMVFGSFQFSKNNVKGLLWRICYKLYQYIPFSYRFKRQCAIALFKHLGFLFRGTTVYKRLMERLNNTHPIVHVAAPATKIADIDAVISHLSFPECLNPVVSVIIPNYGNVPLLLDCLQSIARYLPEIPTEYIVIDDASGDMDVPKLEKIKHLRLLINENNIGFLHNCNRAAAQARGRYLFFLNSDTQVCANWLDSLYQVFQTRPNCGLVGSKLIFANGSLQEAGGILWNDASAWNYGRHDHPDRPQYNYLRETDYCSGAAILVRKDLFDQLGGFDVRYAPAYCEDSDLSFAIRGLGFQVYYQPASVVIHFEGQSHGTDLGSGVKANQVISQKKFQEKWCDLLQKEHFFNATDVFYARDRSRDKPCVLIIDHDIPKPDRDAGSRSIFCLIKILFEQGYNIKFLPHNLWYDVNYTPLLQAMGVEVLYNIEHSNIDIQEWFSLTGKYIDYVFLSRPTVAVDFIKLIEKYTRAKTIFYGHDLHYARFKAEAEMTGQEGLKKIAQKQFEEELLVWKSVDIVCYPSETEVDTVLNILPDCQAFRFPPYFFDSIVYDADQNLANRHNIIFVAGFAHRPNVDAAEWFVRKIFPLIQAQHPEVQLYLIGSHPTAAVRALENDKVCVTGYVTDAQLMEYYRYARVAVIPLRYGAGIKNKVLEALNFGIPVVTTSVGAQGLPWLSSVSDVTDEVPVFAEAVCALLENDHHWCVRSKEAAEELGRYFSKEIMAESIETIFTTPVSRVGK